MMDGYLLALVFNLLLYANKAFTFDSGRQNESGRQISMVKLTWNAEKQVMLRSTQSAEKHVLLWHYHAYFFDGNGET